MTTVITDITQVTPEWLTQILQQKNCLEQGNVRAVKTSPWEKKTSILSPLELTYSGDAPQSAPLKLFIKLYKSNFRSNIFTSPKKEVEFYTIVAPEMPNSPGVRCYNAVYSPETDQAHILLANISETHSQNSSALPPLLWQCEQAIDCIAEFHAFWWEHPGIGKDIGNILDIQVFIQAFNKWFPGFADFLGDRFLPQYRQVYEKALSSLPALWKRYWQSRFAERRALTLTHLDLHFSNFLFPKNPDQGKTCIIDWVSWGGFIGAQDIAYAMALYWYPRRRQVLEKDLVRRYHNELLKHGVENYDWDECWQDYRLAVIVNLFSPILRWTMLDPLKTGWWGGDLERALLAFDDLECAELFD